jgi:cysteine desulfurase
MKKIYFDNAASTKLDEKIFESMKPYLFKIYGNSHGQNSSGFDAYRAIEKARDKIAKLLGVKSSKIIFNGNGVQSNNKIIDGMLKKNEKVGKHILISSIEHRGMILKANRLKAEGYKVEFVNVNNKGAIDVEDLKKKLRDDTAVVSVMHVNNDTGMIQPIEEIVRVVKKNSKALVHSDGVQAMPYHTVDIPKLGVDVYNIATHKFHGPKGASVIYAKNGIMNREDVEIGTTDNASIIGMAKSIEINVSSKGSNIQRSKDISEFMIDKVLEDIEDVKLVGVKEDKVPNITSFVFKGVHRDRLILALDEAGFVVSAGAAWAKGVNVSHVLKTMGIDKEYIDGSLRISLGRFNTMEEMKRFVKMLPKVVNNLRREYGSKMEL